MSLDERVEALTQSVELLASMHRDNELRYAEDQKRYAEDQKRRDDQQIVRDEHLSQLIETLREDRHVMVNLHRDIRDAVERLTNIAAAHDQTLDEHDLRIERIEGHS